MKYAGRNHVPLTTEDNRVEAYPKTKFRREDVIRIRRNQHSPRNPWIIAEDSENWYLILDLPKPPEPKCRECGAREGEVRPRNEYNPPKARHLRQCALCHHYYCDWDFGVHYCGEGPDTDIIQNFTEMMGLDRYR